MKRLILKMMCMLGTFVAFSSVAGACAFFAYQPEVPEELLK